MGYREGRLKKKESIRGGEGGKRQAGRSRTQKNPGSQFKGQGRSSDRRNDVIQKAEPVKETVPADCTRGGKDKESDRKSGQ